MAKKIEIPDEIYEKFEERASDKDLDSAEEYANYILKQVYEKLERSDFEDSNNEEYSEEEEEKVKDRLKDLGYM